MRVRRAENRKRLLILHDLGQNHKNQSSRTTRTQRIKQNQKNWQITKTSSNTFYILYIRNKIRLPKNTKAALYQTGKYLDVDNEITF